jgi:hypothetical protein
VKDGKNRVRKMFDPAFQNFLSWFVNFYILYCKIISEAKYWKKNLSIDQAYELYSKLIKEYTGFDMPASTDISLFSSLNSSSIFVRLQNKLTNAVT